MGWRDRVSARTRLGTVLAALVALGAVSVAPAGAAPAGWPDAGNGLANWRYQPAEKTIEKGNANKLAPKWVYHPGHDVSATPSVEAGAVYFPDWSGNVTKLNAANKAVVWTTSIAAVTGVPGAVSRTTPTISGNTVLVSTQRGARLLALNKATGAVLWIRHVDPHPFAILTQSPSVSNGVVYQGVASSEEGVAADPSYPCCTFIGSMNAFSLATGQPLWRTEFAPSNGGAPGGYSGAAVWGSVPVVDAARGSLYVTTGNNYDVPQDVADCVALDPDAICDDPANLIDAVVALDLMTGAVKWSTKLGGADAWNVACFFFGVNCPAPTGPDFDFGQGAMLLRAKVAGKQRDVLAAGQKSGVFWGLDPATGAVLWSTQAGPGGTLGGLEWGSATDGQRIYFAISNNENHPYDGHPELGVGGAWGALDPGTGAILWRTPDPNAVFFAPGPFGNIVTDGIDPGAVSVANGVMYGGSLAANPTKPTFFALDAATGAIKWSFASGGSVNSGPAIVDGVVYWGSGYRNLGLGSGNDAFYAFSIKGL